MQLHAKIQSRYDDVLDEDFDYSERDYRSPSCYERVQRREVARRRKLDCPEIRIRYLAVLSPVDDGAMENDEAPCIGVDASSKLD